MSFVHFLSSLTEPSEGELKKGSFSISKSKLIYFLDLLIFVIVTSPQKTRKEQELLDSKIHLWNSRKFEKRDVWNFLEAAIGQDSQWLKMATTAILLQQYKRIIEENEVEFFPIDVLVLDSVVSETYCFSDDARYAIVRLLRVVDHMQQKTLDQLLLTEKEIFRLYPKTEKD